MKNELENYYIGKNGLERKEGISFWGGVILFVLVFVVVWLFLHSIS